MICLQGGAEFTPACRDMDGDLVRRFPGRVVVTALAGTPGRDYATATANGVRHLRAVGAEDVVGAPDARDDLPGARAALTGAGLLVLPGGSPSRLLDALRLPGVEAAVAGVIARGGGLLGSSAGAMVLGAWTVLPDQRTADGPAVVEGLGLAGAVLVVPHWSGDGDQWLRAVEAAVPAGIEVLGIPEASGVLVEPGRLTAVGRSATRLVRQGRSLAPGDQLTR